MNGISFNVQSVLGDKIGIEESKAFIATYGVTTNDDIFNAYDSGKMIYAVKDSNWIQPLSYIHSEENHNVAEFCSISGNSVSGFVCENNTWRIMQNSNLAYQNSPSFTGGTNCTYT